MKVIDLLNKIANEEETPKKIKYRGYIYELEEGLYYREDGENKTLRSAFNYLYLERCLNDEVEIIEDKKIPEKLDERILLQRRIEDVGIPLKEMLDKINEIIDYLEDKEQC